MPDFARAALGAFFLALGLLGAAYPYELARYEEMLDAIGSKRRLSEVEPAEWKVSLTRIAGVAFAIVGAAMFAIGLLM